MFTSHVLHTMSTSRRQEFGRDELPPMFEIRADHVLALTLAALKDALDGGARVLGPKPDAIDNIVR